MYFANNVATYLEPSFVLIIIFQEKTLTLVPFFNGSYVSHFEIQHGRYKKNPLTIILNII